MPQQSKLLVSREHWKQKAMQRAEDVREFRKTKKRHQERIAELKAQLVKLEATSKDKKTNRTCR
jgi:uncharacterized protein YlxW (UPF0749 family)